MSKEGTKDLRTNFWRGLWLRITQRDLNLSLEKTSAMRMKITLGSYVIHKPSGAKGIVRDISRMGGHTLLTFVDVTGRLVRGVNRHECQLANSERNAGAR